MIIPHVFQGFCTGDEYSLQHIPIMSTPLVDNAPRHHNYIHTNLRIGVKYLTEPDHTCILLCALSQHEVFSNSLSLKY